VEIPKLLEGKTAVVLGVANKRSIAWAVARRFTEAGARVLITYQDDRLLDKVLPLAESVEGCLTCRCDLTDEADIAAAFGKVEKEFGRLDILTHSVAYALRQDLEGKFSETSAEGFGVAQNVSAYTLISSARAAKPIMEKNGGGSIMAMTYHGSERVIPNYNVMGVAKASLEASIRYLAAEFGDANIRVNGLSPGPISTLAARGISNFTTLLKEFAKRNAFHRTTDVEEVADTAVFMGSDLSRGITGEVLYIDGGYHIMGG
jgi:enoyl-[acyl-carrier protein] reductase I